MTLRRFLPLPAICLLLSLAGLAGCASTAALPKQVYDLGPASSTLPADRRAPLSFVLGEIQTSPALDSNAMLYRLGYDNLQLLKPYAQARWSMAPAQLLGQQLRAALSASGERLLNPADGRSGSVIVRLELDEFSQVFSSPTASEARLQLRVSVSRQHQLIAQRNWLLQVAASSPDAAGGARAMQQASERLAFELRQWLHTLPLNDAQE